jgi:hypothetical protein
VIWVSRETGDRKQLGSREGLLTAICDLDLADYG